MFLAGDVGGTKTLLGLFRRVDGKLKSVRSAAFPSQRYPALEAMVQEFLAEGRQKIHASTLGVAGPVVDGRSQVVNLRWQVDSRRVARRLGLDQVRVINDLEATAWGIPELDVRKLLNLTPDLRARPGNAALIAAGTGLGMSLLIWDGERYHPQASEGGHQEFGPRDELEIDLLRYVRERHGRVSVERIVAGPGVSAIYQFLIDSGRAKQSRRMSQLLAQAGDPNAAIAEAGLAGDRVAAKTMEIFVSLYGAAAGDLALVSKSVGGLYVGGGIAPKILPLLRSGQFVRAFRSKGRLTPLLEQIPIRVILEPRTALIGAAACAEASLAVSRRR
jgi:glucokinase